MNKYDILIVGVNACELLACLTGIVYWQKIKHSYWRWFVVYLGIITLLEATGFYIKVGLQQNNIALYYWLIVPLEFLFFFWLLSKYGDGQAQKKWSLAATVIYVLCFLIDKVWLQHTQFAFSSFSYCIGNVLLLVLIIRFFLTFSTSNDILRYKENGMFWVCLGLMVFYIGSLPFYGLWNTLRNSYPTLFNNYWIVQTVLLYCMYLFFAISFIWGKLK